MRGRPDLLAVINDPKIVGLHPDSQDKMGSLVVEVTPTGLGAMVSTFFRESGDFKYQLPEKFAGLWTLIRAKWSLRKSNDPLSQAISELTGSLILGE